MPVVIIVFIILFFTFFIGAIIAVIRLMKKTDPANLDNSIISTADNAKDFILVDDFGDYYLDLGGYQYRAVIECGSINYDLMTDVEQEIVDLAYHRFLNSLTFPVSISVLTRKIDNTKMVKRLKKNAQSVVNEFQVIGKYADNYVNRMTTLSEDIQHTLQKKKYVIIPYGEAVNMNELNEEEKKEFAFSELMNRVETVIGNLTAVGISAKLLDKQRIFEVLYATYHRNNYLLAREIINENMTDLFVVGKGLPILNNSDEVVVSMLKECKNRIIGISEYTYEKKLYEEISYILNHLEKIVESHDENMKKDIVQIRKSTEDVFRSSSLLKAENVLESFDFEKIKLSKKKIEGDDFLTKEENSDDLFEEIKK